MTTRLFILAALAAALSSCSRWDGTDLIGDPRRPRHVQAYVFSDNTCDVRVDDVSGFWVDASLSIVRQTVSEGDVTTSTLIVHVGTDSAESASLFAKIGRYAAVAIAALYAKSVGALDWLGGALGA